MDRQLVLTLTCFRWKVVMRDRVADACLEAYCGLAKGIMEEVV